MLPAIAYASAIWWPERPNCCLKSRLVSVQRSALLSLTGAYRTTQKVALQILLHAPLIEIELRFLNKEFALLQLRRATTWEGQTMDPRKVALPLNK
ncbi:hypothetical protein MRX96_005961 [Rhipicephalus microplus]